MQTGGMPQAINDLTQWVLEIFDRIKKSNQLNRTATLYTIASVILNALATLLSQLPVGQ